ncbi:annexin B11 isoform X2 [Drosophila hydei]|uniref:Annexin n=1 Tax=Drosophila hydei TaxID=7224 RepID=A0A6J1LAE6_DROHY|nr:annexin B11 isoform X2 [Drosophila hydei]XP_023162945.1 annexin B11 isoform X2 [Drosophila hydei]XP_023162946.1 annexin B11 isoform X2 [Drosophila hydei]
MYPYDSGMANSSYPSANEQPKVPFGVGWVSAPVHQNGPHSELYPPPAAQPYQQQQQQFQQYPNYQHGGGGASCPYPSKSEPYPFNAPYSTNHPQNVTPNQHNQSQFNQHPYATNPAGYTPAMTTSYNYDSSNYHVQQHGHGQSFGHGFGHGHGHGLGQGQGIGYGYGHEHMQQSLNQHFTAHKEGTPTLLPAQGFDPVKDAHDLRKAMKGFGTDEDKLIEIICRRNNEQRQEIQRQYKTHFGKDLIEDIKSETSGNFQKLLVGLLRPIVDYYCAELNDAMAGLGTDEEVLIEILCTLSNVEIHTIKNQYLRLYGAHLESELKSETSGNFKRLLTSLCAAARDESGRVDPNKAKEDARELLKAGELRVGTDESMFNMILCQRNYQQLKFIFQEYESVTGHSLEKALKKEFSGDIMEGLIAIYKCVTNKAEYFASRLHKSMAGIGTNDKQLIRVIITRCEIDLADIKGAFERLYGKSLKSWIKGDTSGHYKHALYALVGEQRSS